jgi:hypothetical protein
MNTQENKQMNLENNAEYKRVKEFLKTIENNSDDWTKKLLLKSVALSLPEVVKMKEEMIVKFAFEGLGKYNVSCELSEDTLTFGICKSFESREEMLQFVTKYSLTLPDKVLKSGHVDSEMKATTNMIYAWSEGDYKFNLSYTRDGLPTAHCRVVKNTEFAVACDIEGNDSEP